MSLTLLQKLALALSGLTATAVGVVIVTVPQVFYAGYGIALGDDPDLLNELRAPAAGLLLLGLVMLAGIWRTSMTRLAVSAAFIVFLAFPAGRLIGFALDGMPSPSIVGAFFIEVAIALLCVFAFRQRLLPSS